MSHFWNPLVKKLTPYVPGEQSTEKIVAKLNTNENPYAPSPLAIKAMEEALSIQLKRYPDSHSISLRKALADYYQLSINQIFVGNGSDEVLAHAFQALFKPEAPILFPDLTYGFYPVYANLYNLETELVPLDKSFGIDVRTYSKPNGGIIFPNPNAPTGLYLGLEAIEALLQANTESVVIIDEAYIDFGGESAIALIDRHPNLLVIQTLSKSRSLAGIRVGFAFGHPDLIEGLNRVKNSFNSYPMDQIALAGAQAAIEDKAYFNHTIAKVIESREWLTNALYTLGFEAISSMANFVLATHKKKPAEAIYLALKEKGILVRHFKQKRIENYLRISIGTEEENKLLIEHLKDIIENS